jgi:hypothetical protein
LRSEMRARQQVLLDDRLRGVQMPDPFEIGALCARLAVARGRAIHLVPFSAVDPDMPCGLWVGLPSADVIFYEQATTRLHRDHFVLHELGHMLSDHDGRLDALVPILTAQLPPGMVDAERLVDAFGLRRASYDTAQEREAEAFARHVGASVRRRGRPRSSGEGAARLDRIDRALVALGGRPFR